jgi:hypothetical protein
MRIAPFLMLLITVAVFAADEKSLRLEAKVDKARIEAGEVVSFEIIADAEKGLGVSIPDVGDKILGLSIEDQGIDGPTERDGRLITKRWYKLKAEEQGSYILPEVELSYEKEGRKETLKTSEIFVEARPFFKEGEEPTDIRDIRPPILLPRRPTIWAILLFSLLAGGVGTWFFLKYRVRREKLPTLTLIPPHEEALLALEALEKKGIPDTPEQKPFYFALSDILRRYFERSWNLAVTDMTFEEIRAALATPQDCPAKERARFLKILADSDIVKFTDTVFKAEHNKLLLGEARQFVEETKPKEIPQNGESVV